MAGSISLSLSQQFNELGEPLAGGFVYFYASGTTTPQSAYQDFALTIPHPNPITLDSAGRVPQLYFADGFIKYVLTDVLGVVQGFVNDNVLVVGPSSGGGGGGSGVDPTTVWQTGDLKPRYGTGAHAGFVRANGRTIGSSTSGGTERANADCQALFVYLWGADANLAVSGGRGGNAAADWAANKAIALPDWRGRVIAALDDMGASAAGRLTASYFGTAATVLGAAGGAESNTLSIAKLPAVTPAGTLTIDPHFHFAFNTQSGAGSLTSTSYANFGLGVGAGDVAYTMNGSALAATIGKTSDTTATGTFNGTPFGGGEAHANVQPTMLATIYIKL